MKIFKINVFTFDIKNYTGQTVYVCKYHFRTRRLCRAYARILLDYFDNCHVSYYRAPVEVLQKLRPFTELFNSTNIVSNGKTKTD